MAAVMPNIRVVHICEGDYPSERWAGLRGRISTAVLQSLAPDLSERVTFTCGPAPYMGAVRRILEESGYDMRNYHEESFSFETLPTSGNSPQVSRDADDTSAETVLEADAGASSVSPDDAVTTYTVEFVKSGRTISCRTDESVLDAAFAAGFRPPSSCSQGMCGTCKTTMLSGAVDMQHNGGIRPKEVAQNKILICCSRPLSDLRIDG
jgi:ferredoxin-NADP reductase